MKIEEVKSNKFEPFTIQMTIENENELKELWCRLNINTNKIKELNSGRKQVDFISSNYIILFDLIDSKINSY